MAGLWVKSLGGTEDAESLVKKLRVRIGAGRAWVLFIGGNSWR
jgi:hypothetical protein